MNRFELTQKLLDGSLTYEEAKASGVEIIDDQVRTDMSCGEYVFGTTQIFEDYFTTFLYEDLEATESDADYALYLDADGNLVHVGKVAHDGDTVYVISKIEGSPFVIVHPIELPPLDLPGEFEVQWGRRL